MRGRRPETVIPGSSPVTEVPTPPAWLSPDGKAEWKRVAPILIEQRQVITLADLFSLASYCCAVGQVAEASRAITKDGLTFKAPSGPKVHPAVRVRSDGMTQARLLAGELGLTPMSRSRPAMREPAAPASDDDLGLDG